MAKKATILIVDREKILVDLLTRALSSHDLSVVGTTSAEDATRLVELHGPDVLVIDPAIQNGMSLIASVSSGSFGPKVVAATGSDEIRDRVRAIGVEKTVDRHAGLDTLVAAIRSSLPTETPVVTETHASVLVVDDEGDIRSLLTEFLESHGYQVTQGKNGQEAVERVANDPSIQILLLDVSMPIMGGIEALRQIMGRDPHPNVIMMTALADREIARQAMKIGAFDYIVKPFDLPAIEASINACLSYSEYQKQPWWKRLTRG